MLGMAVKIALAQIDAIAGDVRGNASRVLEAIDEAKAKGAEVCVFPELVVVGYAPYDLLLRGDLVLEAWEATSIIAREARGIEVVLGTVEPIAGERRCWNLAAVLADGRVAARQAKTLLPAYDVFHEPRHFVSSPRREPVTLAGRRVGLLVCEDMWDEGYDVHPPAEQIAAGAERLFAISASPYRHGVHDERLRHARRHRAPLVYVNGVGGQDELIFDGGSFALDAAGRVVAQLPRFEEAVQVVDLDAASPIDAIPVDADEDLFRALVLGLRSFVRKNGLRKAYLGLSGGVDSALVACLAKEALGTEAVHALALPSRYNDPRSTECAAQLARGLGIGFEVVSIEPLFEAALSTLAPVLAGDGGTTAENVQARLRCLVLMAHVNRRGGILLNTSNKTELTLGYSTLYGDLAGGIAPIADLTKTEVYRLSRWYDARHHVIPEFILTRPASAELKPDQVDPFDYPRISPIAEAIVEGAGWEELRALGATAEEVERIDRLLRQSEHKRWQAPVVLKVSSTAFGRGRLVPITHRHARGIPDP